MSTIYVNELARGKGKIEIIFGPMFSGKTTELIRRMTRYQIATFKCVVIKYAGDTRYSETNVSTHDSKTLKAISCSLLEELKSTASEFDVVGIDEGQFFPDIIKFCEELANNGKIVVVAALDGTFQRTGFGDILNLVPLAESIIKLNAVCMLCYTNASFTKRISNEKAVEIIGGADKYMAVCRECHASNATTSPFSKCLKRTPLKSVDNNDLLVSPPKRMLFQERVDLF